MDSDMEAVKAVFPKAYSRDSGHGTVDIMDSGDKDNQVAVGCGRSVAEAWKDASHRQFGEWPEPIRHVPRQQEAK